MSESNKNTSKNGFTIVELVVVIAIIGILVTITVVSYGAWHKSTLIAKVKSDLNGAVSAMESARTFNNIYPATVPSSIVSSSGVMLSGGSTDGKAYCVDGTSVEDATITYYVDSTSSSKGAQTGTCATRPNLPSPDIPSNLAIMWSTGTQVDLSWNAAANASSYTAECAFDSAFIVGLQSVTVATVTATISGLSPGSTYYCHVNATNANGTSGWTPSLSTTASNDMLAWWKFNGDATDSSGNGSTGIVAGATLTTGATGSANTAYLFGSVGTQNIIGNTPVIGSQLTLSAWINPTSYPTERSTIIEGISPNAYYLSLYTDGSLQVYWYGTTPAGYHTTAAGAIPLNVWSFVSAAWDGTNMRLYVNGVLQTTVSVSTASATAASKLNVGAESSARQFIGSIDDARVYNRALSTTEIQNINAGLAQ